MDFRDGNGIVRGSTSPAGAQGVNVHGQSGTLIGFTNQFGTFTMSGRCVSTNADPALLINVRDGGRR